MTDEQIPPVAQPHVAAGALFTDEAGRILLLRPTYKEHWDIPGGYVEPGESPYAACVRELREELGIAPHVGSLLVVDWAPADGEGDKILYIFDGGSLTPEALSGIAFDDGEASEYRHLNFADVDGLIPNRLARRLRTALAAQRDGRTIYAEHGEEVPDRAAA